MHFIIIHSSKFDDFLSFDRMFDNRQKVMMCYYMLL